MSRIKTLYFQGARIFLGLIFFTAGMSKLMSFPGIIGPVWLEEKLAPHGLGLFARFVAISQIVVGLLLLSKRFATIGAVMLFPLLLCILMVTISLEWQGTPYVNAFLLLINLTLLAADYPKLKFLLHQDPDRLKQYPLVRKNALEDMIWVVGFIIFIIGLLTINYTPAHKILLWIGGLTFISLIVRSSYIHLKNNTLKK